MRARELYDHLVQSLTLEVSGEEKQTIIRWLLQERLSLSVADVRSEKLVSTSPAEFAEAIHRINSEEPLQYILGNSEFYGRTFLVNPSVLIPRPETELLAKYVIDAFSRSPGGQLLDIGTGSGCIAVTLELELPHFRVAATDVDPQALALAKRNSTQLGATVLFVLHNILTEALPFQSLDAVVSNPPYIKQSERNTLAKSVIGFEPELALFVPDSDPLVFHRVIAEKAQAALRPGGVLLLEINEKLGPETAAVVEATGFTQVAVVKDMDSKNRFVTGRTPE